MMTKPQHIIPVILLIFLIACSEVSGNNEETLDENIQETELSNDSLLIIKKEFEEFKAPIDMNLLKNLPDITTTSGVLPNSESTELCRPSDFGFFGHYQLLENGKYGNDFIGQLNVFVTDNAENWKFNNTNEIFSEIRLESNKIKVWGKIGVGTSQSDLREFISDNFSYKKGTIIYAELGEYTLNATILGDSINKLTVGKYCK